MLFFFLPGRLATLFARTLLGTGGGAGLVADSPTLRQVVLGYRLPVARPNGPDLTQDDRIKQTTLSKVN